MQKRPLGSSGLEVSAICLGTMTWGEQNDERDAFAQLDRALAAGVTFVDLAEMYPIPPRAETYGETEAIFGRWLASRKARGRLVLATKVAGPDGRLGYVRDGHPSYARAQIEAAVDASLERLGVDCIDLYQLHWPEREANRFGKLGFARANGDPGTPFETVLETLGRLVAAGKVRHVGLSNETAWGAMRFLALAEQGAGPRMVSIQNPYSLLNRSFEVGLAEVAARENLGLMAYSPLGMGVLTGKYLDGEPAQARLTRYRQYRRYSGPQAVAATRAYVELARRHGVDPAQMALAFVLARPFVASAIIGATTLEQLESDLGAANLVLAPELEAEIEAIHRVYTYPAP